MAVTYHQHQRNGVHQGPRRAGTRQRLPLPQCAGGQEPIAPMAAGQARQSPRRGTARTWLRCSNGDARSGGKTSNGIKAELAALRVWEAGPAQSSCGSRRQTADGGSYPIPALSLGRGIRCRRGKPSPPHLGMRQHPGMLQSRSCCSHILTRQVWLPVACSPALGSYRCLNRVGAAARHRQHHAWAVSGCHPLLADPAQLW